MLPFQVRRFRGRYGDEVILLTRRGGLPYFYPNVFGTGDYRNTSKAANTVAKVLRSIGLSLMWAESIGRDLDHELAHGHFIGVQDADDLAAFLGLTAVDQIEAYQSQGGRKSPGPPKVIKLESYRSSSAALAKQPSTTADAMEVGARIRWVAKYAEWHLQNRLHRLEIDGHEYQIFKDRASAAIARLRSLAPSVSDNLNDDQDLEAPDVTVVESIEGFLHPASPDNPFRSPFVKIRNYLIWRLLLDTGARRHEVLAARSQDVSYAERRFKIVESKTIRRTVAIRAKTADAFDTYIMEFWSKLPATSQARTEGYLFCDQNGQRINLRQINRLFETIRGRIDEQPQKISPHTMRRFWNHLFSKQVDEVPEGRRMSEAKEVAFRMMIMGWSTDRQAKRYNKRHIREKGDEIAQKMMDRFSGS